ncbi:PREDICTED: lithostathine-1-beta [Chrysochloris asiatica]|uniref:Lithostathine-1-beta n=1 Tax=Chrysochloris asiatica TaxID=185453 RepID=A0A9B0U5E4_CHRAS|nr:PREDICTED: lithostathine-1-beta [Chrysochloris asiatica]
MACASSCLILSSFLMLLSLSQGQEAKTELPNALIRCPEGTNNYGSHCYYLNQDQETWFDANLSCQNTHSGHLVSLLNQAEGTFVASLIKETSTDNLNVWTGLHDPKMNRRWQWSSGSVVSYKAWAQGAPSSTNPGYCASLTSNSGFEQWKDEHCEKKLHFVCKFKI